MTEHPELATSQQALPEAAATAADAPGNDRILRFAKSERMMHWAIAAPFLVSFASAIVLVAYSGPQISDQAIS